MVFFNWTWDTAWFPRTFLWGLLNHSKFLSTFFSPSHYHKPQHHRWDLWDFIDFSCLSKNNSWASVCYNFFGTQYGTFLVLESIEDLQYDPILDAEMGISENCVSCFGRKLPCMHCWLDDSRWPSGWIWTLSPRPYHPILWPYTIPESQSCRAFLPVLGMCPGVIYGLNSGYLSLRPTVLLPQRKDLKDPMSKQRLAHWVVDVTTKAYKWAELPDSSDSPRGKSPQGQYLVELSAHTSVLRNDLLMCACMSLTKFVTSGGTCLVGLVQRVFALQKVHSSLIFRLS